MSAARAQWAGKILSESTGPTWLLLGMLADLSEDCAKLVRLFDKQDVDAMHCMVHADDFICMLHREYVEGAMWRRRGTYSDKIDELLRDRR